MQIQENPLEFYRASFKSTATADSYCYCLNRFCSGDMGSLLLLDSRAAEDKLISFIIDGKKCGMNWGSLHNYVAAVTKFYEINDVTINLRRVNRFMPEPIKVRKDRAYRYEEIHKVVTLCNERTRAVILLLVSTGMRLGALATLKYGDLEDKGSIYKITVYTNTKSEYFTYCTPECKAALQTYFEIRERHGEAITNKKSPVIREQYDKRNPFAAQNPKPTTKGALSRILQQVLELAGLRASPQEHEVMLAHGFRKFFNTQLGGAKINLLVKEMLMGHTIGLEASYYRPEESYIQSEYEKAIDVLTIDPTKRLQKKVDKYEKQEELLHRLGSLLRNAEEKGYSLEQLFPPTTKV